MINFSTWATTITAVNTVAAEENANALIKYTMEERKSSEGIGSDVGIN